MWPTPFVGAITGLKHWYLSASISFTSVQHSSELIVCSGELAALLTMSGAEVMEDPWDLAEHHTQMRLMLMCDNPDSHSPTPAELDLFNGEIM